MEHEIDLVYLWVDGSDEKWLAKRNAFIGKVDEKSNAGCKGRYADNQELKYSLRSAEKYAPWIRKIFIVTDEQAPDWLDTANPRIKIVDHKDIMPKESLPCFNSFVIEYFLYKIPGLSEYFLYANDDMFFNAGVQPDFFFKNDGCPVIRLNRKPFGKWHYRFKILRKKKKSATYFRTLHKAASLVKKKYGKYYPETPHHNIDAYRKNDFREAVENVFGNEVKETLSHRTRSDEDLERAVVSYYMLAIGHGHIKLSGKKREPNPDSMIIHVRKPNFMKRLISRKPSLFCLNDCPRTTDGDRARIKPFLEALFQEKSAFEK
jgi:hypothetical protein